MVTNQQFTHCQLQPICFKFVQRMTPLVRFQSIELVTTERLNRCENTFKALSIVISIPCVHFIPIKVTGYKYH